MPCFHPLRGYRARAINPETGKRPIVFNISEGIADMPVDFACGQCVGCRLERSRQWAVRCVHEASLHENNCFITLTFNDDALAKRANPFTVDVRDFQLFMKRFRKKYGEGIRYFHCGEYGEKTQRPHYHACIFGFDFPDKKLWKVSNGHRLYTSEKLNALWEHKGYCVIGDVTWQSAAYVARYIMKKITGDKAEQHYQLIDELTGEIYERNPEYTTMSRRPGIAKGWFDKFGDELYVTDSVVINGHELRVPKFYDSHYELSNPLDYRKIKAQRRAHAKKNDGQNTPHRLYQKEQCKLRAVEKLIRPID